MKAVVRYFGVPCTNPTYTTNDFHEEAVKSMDFPSASGMLLVLLLRLPNFSNVCCHAASARHKVWLEMTVATHHQGKGSSAEPCRKLACNLHAGRETSFSTYINTYDRAAFGCSVQQRNRLGVPHNGLSLPDNGRMSWWTAQSTV
jgi:hypothetical protein